MQDFERIAARFGTPLYVYDAGRLRHNARRFFDAITYRPLSVYAALMANDNPHLLRLCREAGLGAFVNSPRHLAAALAVGCPPGTVIYASSNVPAPLIEHMAARGVVFHANSLRELAVYGAYASARAEARHEIGLRIAWTLPGAARPARLGVSHDEIAPALALAHQHTLRINGLHVYLGTNLDDARYYLAQVHALLPLVDCFPDVSYLDLSGGFPANGDFDYAALDAGLGQLLSGRGIKLVLEPGRSLFASAGTFLTRVIEVRARADHTCVGVDGSASQLPLALFHGDTIHYPVSVVGRECAAVQRVSIEGATTYSRDFLAREIALPPVEPGDLLAFGEAGAYGYSYMTGFLGVARPAEVLIDGADITLITPREEITL